jgi:hypothetical protein
MDEKTPNDWTNKIKNYFTRNDLIIIVIIAIIAFLTSSYGLSHLLPGGSAPGLVHAFLKLPGPGAGIFIASAFTCLWLVLGILITKKPGTVILIALLIIVFSLVSSLAMIGLAGHGGQHATGNRHASTGNSSPPGGAAVGQPAGGETTASGASEGMPAGGQPIRFDYLALVVAIIIESAGLLALEKKPWRFVFPSLLTLMGIITLAMMLTGNAKMGENGAAATVFPLGYAVSGILALCLAVILLSYPEGKYIIGAGCAEVFYIGFSWLFNGRSGFATWLPVSLAIPALLTFAFVCGALMAAIAYGFYLLWDIYTKHGTEPGVIYR